MARSRSPSGSWISGWVRPNPQAAIARTKQRVSTTGVELVNTIVPRFEVDAIEAQKPVPGADPKKADRRLREGNGRRVNCAVLQPPGSVSVLR
jgi:hypothetical protein